MARLPSYISRVETPAGVRYEARVNPPRSGSTRRQLKRRFAAVADAVDWHTRTTAEFGDGTYIAPSELTVKEACATWLKAKALRAKPTTIDVYTAALRPVIERYGDRTAQSVIKGDVEALIVELAAGTAYRQPWARTSINPMLAR